MGTRVLCMLTGSLWLSVVLLECVMSVDNFLRGSQSVSDDRPELLRIELDAVTCTQ